MDVAEGMTTSYWPLPFASWLFERGLRIECVVDNFDARFLGEILKHMGIDIIRPTENIDLAFGAGGLRTSQCCKQQDRKARAAGFHLLGVAAPGGLCQASGGMGLNGR